MYVIVAYDVNVERVNRIKKFCGGNWVQNSLSEGELSEADLEEVRMGLRRMIDEEKDMIVIYRMRSSDTIRAESI